MSPIISLLAVLLAMAAGLFLGPRLFGESKNIATEGIQNSADLTSPAAPAPAVPDPEQTALDKLRGRWGLFNGDATDCAAPAEIRISDKKSLTIVDRGQPSVETIERIDPAGPVHTVSGAQKSVYSIAGDMLSVSVDGAEPSRYKSCE